MMPAQVEGCAACKSRPRGERGHADLRVLFRAGRPVGRHALLSRYGCAACARIWERRLLVQGFLWMMVAAPTESQPRPMPARQPAIAGVA